MVNVYSDIISYSGDEWEEYFEKICLIDIFKELILKYQGDRPLLKSFIRYVMFTYSKDSDKVIIGDDWLKNKKRIFDICGFEPKKEFQEATVYLKDEIIFRTVKRWVYFQDESTFTQICVLSDLLLEMQISANSPIRKSSGEIDFDQKYKNACYVKDLREMIRDCESELIQNSDKLKEAYKEVAASANKYVKRTMGLETMLAQHRKEEKEEV